MQHLGKQPEYFLQKHPLSNFSPGGSQSMKIVPWILRNTVIMAFGAPVVRATLVHEDGDPNQLITFHIKGNKLTVRTPTGHGFVSTVPSKLLQLDQLEGRQHLLIVDDLFLFLFPVFSEMLTPISMANSMIAVACHNVNLLSASERYRG
jgi:hypothetical protein